MLSYGGVEGYGLGSYTRPATTNPNPSTSGGSDGATTSGAATNTVYVVFSTLEWRRRRRHPSIQADCVYSNPETAYSHAFARVLEDGAACLDDDGIERLGRIARDMAAMSLPFKESWRRIYEFLEAEKRRLDWDVWPSCWVQETEMSVRRQTGGPMRIVEGLVYLFSDEAAAESSDDDEQEEQQREEDGGGNRDEYRNELAEAGNVPIVDDL